MNILLVEDDPLISDVMAKALRQEGWNVDHVATAYGALAALVEHAYSAVLLDLGLASGASGMDVLRDLRGRYDAVPVVIVTARDQLRDRLRGLAAGADDYLIKPFQIDELVDRVTRPAAELGAEFLDTREQMFVRGVLDVLELLAMRERRRVVGKFDVFSHRL